MKIKSIFFAFLFFFTKSLIADSGQFVISSVPDSALNLRPYLKIYTDETNALTIKEVRQLQNTSVFQPFDGYEFKSVLERGKYTYWFYLDVNYLPTQSEAFILRGFGGYTLDLFQFSKEQLVYTVSGGDLTPATDTANIAYYKSDLPITLSSGNTTFFIKYSNKPTHYLSGNSIRLIKANTGLHASNKDWIIYYGIMGLFFGGLFFVFLSSIAQYFQVKSSIYLFYAIYILSLWIYYWRFYAGDNPFFRIMPTAARATEYFTLFNLPIYFTYLLFLRAFIGDNPIFKQIRRATSLFLGALIIYFVIERTAMLFSLNWAFRVEVFGRPLFLIFVIGLLISLLQTNQKGPIRYILYGTFALLFLVLLGILITTFNISPSWYKYNIANSFTQLGVLIELVCFSAGVGAQAKIVAQEKKTTEFALQAQRQAAEHKRQISQLKDRFFTNITHEFRTPLTVIKGLAQQIQIKPSKDLNRRTTIIQSNTDRLLELVNQLLDLSKTNLQQYPINNVQQDIIKYLSYLIDAFYSLALAKKINLSFHSQVEQQLMDFDPKIIQTLVNNLVGNALKFTPAYGKIKVVATLLSEGEISTKLKAAESKHYLSLDFEKTIESKDGINYLGIAIKDTGLGITAEDLPLIFDRFYQVDASSTKNTHGTGIGLSLVKELMKLLEGKILVTSIEKEGSTFQLFLPIHNEVILKTVAEPTSINLQSIVNSDPSDKTTLENIQLNQSITTISRPINTLLIVEDNVDVVYFLRDFLSTSFNLLIATNGKEGLEIALQQIPDVILSDVMMPEMDGFEFCEKLKNDLRTSHIPIIMLTAKVDEQSKYRGLEVGADAYLAKPFDKKELLLRLDNLILRKKQLEQYLLLNSTVNTLQQLPSAIADKELAFLQQLRAAVLEQLHHEWFKAPQLARAMMMSPTQLYRKLKALTNQSTAQYIKLVRLEQAKKLLLTTDYPIGRIATEVGFKTSAHFSRVFQEVYGVTPSGMRN